MTWGSVDHHHRIIAPHSEPDKRKRRMCRCGCRKKTTHLGVCNGVTLMSGCELSVMRWVKDWRKSIATKARLRALAQQEGGDGRYDK